MRSKQSSDGSSKIDIIVDDMNDSERSGCSVHTDILQSSMGAVKDAKWYYSFKLVARFGEQPLNGHDQLGLIEWF